MADVLQLADMTWEELAARPKAGLVAILPVGATEAHGPHLPLGTDVIIAEAMSREGASRLASAGRDALLAPALAYTVAGYAAGFAGTVSIRPETAVALVEDVGRGLAAHGVETLCIANAHLEPTHLATLHDAALRLAGVLRVVFPDVTKKPWALRLSDEFKSGACHAGCYEGSIVLAARPELVRADLARTLPANPASLSRAIREGKTTFESAGGPRAYFGDPAAATAEEGRATIAVLGSILCEAVLAS